jgi:hypothetical protein
MAEAYRVPTPFKTDPHERAPAMTSDPGSPDQALAQLTDLFCRGVRALARAGQPDEANRLAARAWWVLRETSPAGAEHVNGVMHFIARLPGTPQTERTTA